MDLDDDLRRERDRFNSEPALLAIIAQQQRAILQALGGANQGPEPSDPVAGGSGVTELREPVSQHEPPQEDAAGADDDDPVDVSSYHTGGGWYEIDGRKYRGEEAARQALRG